MKINQCGINITVKTKKDISRQIKKGDLVKIRFVDQKEETIDVDNGEVVVAEIDPKYFEPISKFKIEIKDDSIRYVGRFIADAIKKIIY